MVDERGKEDEKAGGRVLDDTEILNAKMGIRNWFTTTWMEVIIIIIILPNPTSRSCQ